MDQADPKHPSGHTQHPLFNTSSTQNPQERLQFLRGSPGSQSGSTASSVQPREEGMISIRSARESRGHNGIEAPVHNPLSHVAHSTPGAVFNQAPEHTSTQTSLQTSGHASQTTSGEPSYETVAKQPEGDDSKPAGKPVDKSQRKTDFFKDGINGKLPPLTNIDKIFQDMTSRAFTNLGLERVLKRLGDRPFRVATMCSGTESPLLALRMIRDSLLKLFEWNLHFEHLFSAEIVPHVQAYIERNFHPDLIFRDIREVACKKKASTAYGNPSEVPGDVNILVAGFSCVDFSNLNSKMKGLADAGESGETFFAIVKYAKRFRPAIVILENIMNAPWDHIKAVWVNDKKVLAEKGDSRFDGFWDEDKPYAACVVKVDTKQYYLPQTRTRKYMICIDRKKHPKADTAVKAWARMMKKLSRQASSPAEDFLLKEEDPRLQRGKNNLLRSGGKATTLRQERGWVKSMDRHQVYRARKMLGTKRPLTRWVNGGTCKGPDYWWLPWLKQQMPRSWDVIEIAHLRKALRGFDSLYKHRYWELTQNVDRAQDQTPTGVVPCITPSGVTFMTTRGGPILGLENLALQGLPIDKLLLTRETQSALRSMAGNAMTSTVIGAALIAALIVGSNAFRSILTKTIAIEVPQQSIPHTPMNVDSLQDFKTLDLTKYDQASVKALCALAEKTARLCYCEGPTKTAKQAIRECAECMHTCCRICAGAPEHAYQDSIRRRSNPHEFQLAVRDAIPTRLTIHAVVDQLSQLDSNFQPSTPSMENWKIFKAYFLKAIGNELHLVSVASTGSWKVHYESKVARLDLIFAKGQASWQLFAKPNPKLPTGSAIRTVLDYPMARMIVKGNDVLDGNLEICLPVEQKYKIVVRGKGVLKPSWYNGYLGIEDPDYVDRQVWSMLNVAFEQSSLPAMEHDITGDYERLPNCGTAMHGLHRRVQQPDDHEERLFLFLDSKPLSDPKNDQYVFSSDTHRLDHHETRDTVARIEPGWQPSELAEWRGICTTYGKWVPFNTILTAFGGLAPARYAIGAAKSMRVPTESQGLLSETNAIDHRCTSSPTALLSFRVPTRDPEALGWQDDLAPTIIKTDQPRVFSSFEWLTAKVRGSKGIPNEWHRIEISDRITRCQRCAPKKPAMKWKLLVKSGKATGTIVPYEDGKEAGAYERAIKARPDSFVVQTSLLEADGIFEGHLDLALNITTMVHRVLAKITIPLDAHNVNVDWRLNGYWEPTSEPIYTSFTLMNNKLTPKNDHRMPIGTLRPEQLRSLSWMIGQEAKDREPFFNQEVEEATLHQLGWRAEIRVRFPQWVLGGALADDVGYGKTITTLALIHTQKARAEEDAREHRCGQISIKATLIIMPKHLLGQWAQEAKAFLGQTCKIIVIANMVHLNKLSVRDLIEADIVLFSWSTLSSPVYMKKLSVLAALPDCIKIGKVVRAFETWMAKASTHIADHTEELKYTTATEFATTLQTRRMEAKKDEQLHKEVPLKRLKGAKYVAQQNSMDADSEDSPDVDVDFEISESKESDAKDFKHISGPSVSHMKSPSLQMFHFNRLVLDEYTYVKDNHYTLVQSLKASSRWVLSGTPCLDSFAHISSLAGLLGVNLGISDEMEPSRRTWNQTTDAERFDAYSELHTHDWHASRQAHAQTFLNHFVRKNAPEIGEIPCVEILKPVKLHSAERIIFMELQQQLVSQETDIVRVGQSASDGDRVKRMTELLSYCSTPGEALIKRCSYFTPENGSVQGYRQTILQDRRKEENSTMEEVERHLRHASWLAKQRKPPQKEEKWNNHFEKWKSAVLTHDFGEKDVTKELSMKISAADEAYHFSHEDEFYREQPSKEEQIQERKEARERAEENKTRRADARKLGKKAVKSLAEEIKKEDEELMKITGKPVKIDKEDNTKITAALRAQADHLQILTRELVARDRALRFLENACFLQDSVSQGSTLPACAKCKKSAQQASDLYILGSCGHIGCGKCLNSRDDDMCILHTGPDKSCDASAQEHTLTSAAELAPDRNEKECFYGSKLDEIIRLIKYEIPEDEQVLLFVQFDDLMSKISEAFEKEGIRSHTINGTSANILKNVTDFQNNKTESKKKVMLLNSSNETAAGLNLTNANHVIFVSPLLAKDQSAYDASYKQAIGRAKRYGQKKLVHIYNFLALHTIDVEIYEEREGKRLFRETKKATYSNKEYVKWRGRSPNEMTEEERGLQWGSKSGLTKGFVANCDSHNSA